MSESEPKVIQMRKLFEATEPEGEARAGRKGISVLALRFFSAINFGHSKG